MQSRGRYTILQIERVNTPGMTFDCVSEAQEFYNIYIYSWEDGFGTKEEDKYGKIMQEFQSQYHEEKAS